MAKARDPLARSPGGALTLEDAIRLELAADPDLCKRYLGRA